MENEICTEWDESFGCSVGHNVLEIEAYFSGYCYINADSLNNCTTGYDAGSACNSW